MATLRVGEKLMSNHLEGLYEDNEYRKRSLSAASLSGKMEAYITMGLTPQRDTLIEWYKDACSACSVEVKEFE